MKLYDLKRGTTFHIKGEHKFPPAHPLIGDVLIEFSHLDGMYSFCRVAEGPLKGEIVHPAAWTEVEVVETPKDVPPVDIDLP